MDFDEQLHLACQPDAHNRIAVERALQYVRHQRQRRWSLWVSSSLAMAAAITGLLWFQKPQELSADVGYSVYQDANTSW